MQVIQISHISHLLILLMLTKKLTFAGHPMKNGILPKPCFLYWKRILRKFQKKCLKHIKKYWGNCIGGTDDSLTLLDYLLDKQKPEITLSEIFADSGLNNLNWNFRTSSNLKYIGSVDGSVSLRELVDDEEKDTVRITFTEEEKML